MSFTIDGLEWQYPCQITREAKLTASEISSLMLDKNYFNDCLGTWMQYTVVIAVPFGSEDEYAQIYESLTQPVDGHVFVFPYNNSTITITARVTGVTDVWVKMPGNKNYWKGTEFTVIANHPSKTMNLAQTLLRGRTPFPDLATVEDGATFTYTTENGWIVTPTYDDLDNVYF